MSTKPGSTAGTCVCTAVRNFWDGLTSPTRTQDYPPISSIPRTSPARLNRAVPTDPVVESKNGFIPASSAQAVPYRSGTSDASSSVLYLAYGSNLCSETFLGRRGIRPISAVPVSAPSLRLTFDLPGIAYQEPCFANVAPRKVPEPPKLPPDWPHPDPPPGFQLPPGVSRPPAALSTTSDRGHASREWDNGLIGVVYEVTPEDYATIVATEGGGASYHEILVPCFPFPEKPPGVPEKPSPVPELPKFFLALTLCAPRIPNKPGDGEEDDKSALADNEKSDDDGDDGDDDDKNPLDCIKNLWKKMLLQPVRPDPDYAQPSARYLKLITDGAAEHDLPVDYQRWLASLQPYTITTRLQSIGKWLFLAVVAPWMLLYLALGKLVAGEDGRVPAWFGLAAETFFHLTWTTYDRAFKPVFGDGERTVEEDEDDGRQGKWSRMRRTSLRRADGDVEEKAGLLR